MLVISPVALSLSFYLLSPLCFLNFNTKSHSLFIQPMLSKQAKSYNPSSSRQEKRNKICCTSREHNHRKSSTRAGELRSKEESVLNTMSNDGTVPTMTNNHCYELGGFLKNCYACRKKIGDEDDVFMYRCLRAFCSPDCRYQHMALDDEDS